MAIPGWSDAADDDRYPNRRAERSDVRDELEGRLTDSGVWVSGRETDDEILAMLNAVEDFTRRVARMGGDSMVNTPESSRPDDDRLVLPERRDDETVASYVARVRAAIARL